MNRNTTHLQLAHPGAAKSRFSGRSFTGGMTLLALLVLLFATSMARAACGDTTFSRSKPAIRLPLLGQAESGFLGGPNPSIVGLWHVVYTANGATFNETLDQWHSDGTEFENADLPPGQGNICFGVWKQTGARTVKLHHIGWTFDTASGAVTGTFTLDETNTVSRDGSAYTGNFLFQVYDLDGNVISAAETKGTIAATRITVQ